MTITWTTFAIRLLVGFFLAVGIGIERQWLKTRAVLKTNVLVTLGSAMFVMLSIMTPGDASPTRISAQIVSGVGFLGGGVILREGASVRGINTAATLWCAAAIGTLVGSGFLIQAYVSTLAVVGANLFLRPLVRAFKQKQDSDEDSILLDTIPTPAKRSRNYAYTARDNFQYVGRLICASTAEASILELISQIAEKRQLSLIEMQINNLQDSSEAENLQTEIKVKFRPQNSANQLQDSKEIIKLLKNKVEVHSVSWQILSLR